VADPADIQKVAKALCDRAATEAQRAYALAGAYIDAATARAVNVTTARELPPTAMKPAQINLLVEVLERFDDVPTAEEVSALLRVTSSNARGLLNEVLATSDVAATRLLKSVFGRATRGKKTGPGGDIPNGVEWHFKTRNDLVLARQRLEFAGVNHRTRSTTDGSYVLLIDPAFKPG